MHEYAHLLLRSGGLCDVIAESGSSREDQNLEARCNRIAASILMPERAVRNAP
jgi:Zn-dependent peptidase ImmA (M78 family)